MKLVAVSHILYLSKQYKPGEELPQTDQKMVNLWIASGAAKYKDEPKKTTKAKPVTAPAGRTGKSIPKTSEDDLTGKVPKKK